MICARAPEWGKLVRYIFVKFTTMNNKTTYQRSGETLVSETTKIIVPHESLSSLFYRLCRQWKSEMDFVEDELNFFRLLIDRHLELLIDLKHIERTRSMVAHIVLLANERRALLGRIENHMQHIRALMESRLLTNVSHSNEEYTKLESDFADFMERFRVVKSEVFNLTERVIHTERAKRVVDWG